MQNNSYNRSSHIIYTVKRPAASRSRGSKATLGLQALCGRFTEAEFFALLALLGLQLAFVGVFLGNCVSHGFSRAPGHTVTQVKKVLHWPFAGKKKPESKDKTNTGASIEGIQIYIEERNKLLNQ